MNHNRKSKINSLACEISGYVSKLISKNNHATTLLQRNNPYRIIMIHKIGKTPPVSLDNDRHQVVVTKAYYYSKLL